MFFKRKGLIAILFATTMLSYIFGLFWGCGLPDPFEGNKPTAPTISGYSDGEKIFLTFDGDYASSDFPNFSGINIYFGDNNDLNEIQKRVLLISQKAQPPSIKVSLFNEQFPIKTELSDALSFRLTSSAKESDLSDEGVNSVNEPITNRKNWTVAPGKIFYFAAKTITQKTESDISEKIEISVPIEETATIKYSEEHTIKIQNSDGESIKTTFSSSVNGQRVNFEYDNIYDSKAKNSIYAESLSMVSDEEWKLTSLPSSKKFSKKSPVYGKNYIIFAQLKKQNKVDFYVKIFVKEVTSTHVDVIIHKFNKK